MLKPILLTLVVWSTILPACSHSENVGIPVQSGQAQGASPELSVPISKPLKLTSQQPVASVRVAPNVVAEGRDILEVPVIEVRNPRQTPIEISVYFSSVGKGSPKEGRIEVGSFSLYPADRPGNFLIRATKALETLRTKGWEPGSELSLIFEMRPVRENEGWGDVAVTIGEVKWRQDNEKKH